MKVTIITVCFNSAATIRDALHSVASQSHADIEHIVIDGGSVDDTVAIVQSFGHRVASFVSEPDRGIYDAMNKGLHRATGDVIGFLNSDDVYENYDIVRSIAEEFRTPELDAVFADAIFVDRSKQRNVRRRYSSKRFSPDALAWGWMPAHPTLFMRREIYERYGDFRVDYRIAGDFELIARIFTGGLIRYRYLPQVLVRMSIGGASNSGLKSKFLLNREVLRACRENGIATNAAKIASKYLLKALEFAPFGPHAHVPRFDGMHDGKGRG